MDEIRLTRAEEAEIDRKLGDGFKRTMTDFANKVTGLMLEFPMAQGHSREARYLQQPFDHLCEAARLCRRFGASEAERDQEDRVRAEIPHVLDRLAAPATSATGGKEGE